MSHSLGVTSIHTWLCTHPYLFYVFFAHFHLWVFIHSFTGFVSYYSLSPFTYIAFWKTVSVPSTIRQEYLLCTYSLSFQRRCACSLCVWFACSAWLCGQCGHDRLRGISAFHVCVFSWCMTHVLSVILLHYVNTNITRHFWKKKLKFIESISLHIITSIVL